MAARISRHCTSGKPASIMTEKLARRGTHVPTEYLAAHPDELIAFCRARLAGYKYPRRITIVNELPKSATGKILKGKLREPSA